MGGTGIWDFWEVQQHDDRLIKIAEEEMDLKGCNSLCSSRAFSLCEELLVDYEVIRLFVA